MQGQPTMEGRLCWSGERRTTLAGCSSRRLSGTLCCALWDPVEVPDLSSFTIEKMALHLAFARLSEPCLQNPGPHGGGPSNESFLRRGRAPARVVRGRDGLHPSQISDACNASLRGGTSVRLLRHPQVVGATARPVQCFSWHGRRGHLRSPFGSRGDCLGEPHVLQGPIS